MFFSLLVEKTRNCQLMPTEITLEIGGYLGLADLNALIQTQKIFANIFSEQLYCRGCLIEESRYAKGQSAVFSEVMLSCASKWKSVYATDQVLKMARFEIACHLYIPLTSTPILHIMAAVGNEKMVRLLLRTMSVHTLDTEGRTALWWAVMKKHQATAEMLLRAGAKAVHTDKIGLSIIMEAVRTESVPVFKMLMESAQDACDDIFEKCRCCSNGPCFGADASAQDNEGDYPLLIALRLGDRDDYRLNESGIRALIQAFDQVSTQNKRGLTPLHVAASSWEPWLIELLLEKGAQVSAWCSGGGTPLHFAARSRREGAIIDLLLQYGANPYIREGRLRAPINMTARNKESALL
ncbi:hypothetical protein AJ79_07866 [Helicocarpus griseus UAMH5409]|uniref:Uncharacterized protein n=1 Tax=Helicocarpus griseus UAMH5409 TaxID=1447875 RepID=A0A2B7WYX1_9EURO|nr:hypothetical protein AJ79_07866 [Helicocarpus griseus UAMH5409]